MTVFPARTRKFLYLRLIAAYMGIALLLSCGVVYIYSVNAAVVGSIGIENIQNKSETLEEEVQRLSGERGHFLVGYDLAELAGSVGLEKASSIHYVHTGNSVARSE